MREYLEKGGPIADCYFADNDLIAIDNVGAGIGETCASAYPLRKLQRQ